MTWENINKIDLGILRNARISLHQAVQIVSAFPRNMLPTDPTDSNASLIWNSSTNGLESDPVANEGGKSIRVGLSLDSFTLYISVEGKLVSFYEMDTRSVFQGLEWLKFELSQLDIASDTINLDLPYEIEDYDYSQSLKINSDAFGEHCILYQNISNVLSGIVDERENALDIRCWPHHFDLATLIPLESNSDKEIIKSIGVGLSPGDEAVEEPYIYINVWPSVDYKLLVKYPLILGEWNVEGWSGAILKYSRLTSSTNQYEDVMKFIDTSINGLLTEID